MAGFNNGGGGGISQLTGDVAAGPGTGSQAATLATVATAGTVGDASHYPVITIDAKGRVTTATAQTASGVAIPPYPGNWFPVYGSSSTSLSPVVGRIYVVPIVITATHTYVALGSNVGTAGSAATGRWGIYNDNGGTPVGGTLVLDAGTATMNATGNATVTISQSLTPGLYWLAFVVNSATTAPKIFGTSNVFGVPSIGSSTIYPNQYGCFSTTATTYTGALPATYPAGAPDSTGVLCAIQA